jgi:hypothetical protein
MLMTTISGEMKSGKIWLAMVAEMAMASREGRVLGCSKSQVVWSVLFAVLFREKTLGFL